MKKNLLSEANRYLETEELDEGVLSKTLGTLGVLASFVMGANREVTSDPLVDAYSKAKTEEVQTKLVTIAVLHDLVGGGNKFVDAALKVGEKAEKTEKKADFIKQQMEDFASEMSEKTEKKTDGIRTQFIPAVGKDKKSVEAEANKMLSKIDPEEAKKLGEIVVDTIDMDGDTWYAAYPKNGNSGFMFFQKARG